MGRWMRWGNVRSRRSAEALDDVPDSQTAADRLLEAALASGAEDDMTVMVIQIA